MKFVFNIALSLILGSSAFGAQGRAEDFFASVTSHFYVFHMSVPELRAALTAEVEPKNRMLLETVIKIKSASAHSNPAYDEFAASLVEFYGLRDAESPEFQILDDLELLSIRWYTGDDYRKINSALRGDAGLSSSLSGFISVLDRALEKLPKYEGSTNRGTNLPETIGNTYVVGNIVSDPTYLSTSVSMQYPGLYQLKIFSRSGRWIDPISQNKGEGEVLFSRGTKFKVLRRENRADHVFIELEEVAQSLPRPAY